MHATTVRFTDDLWELLEREAAEQGVSVAQFVRDAALMRVAIVMSKRGDADGALARLAAAATARPQHPSRCGTRSPQAAGSAQQRAARQPGVEARFDRLTRVAAHALNAPVALLTVVADDRQFLKSGVGLPEPWHSEREMALSHSFCQHGVGCADPLVVADARDHPQLRDSAAIADLGAIAYLGVPLRTSDSYELGALSASSTTAGATGAAMRSPCCATSPRPSSTRSGSSSPPPRPPADHSRRRRHGRTWGQAFTAVLRVPRLTVARAFAERTAEMAAGVRDRAPRPPITRRFMRPRASGNAGQGTHGKQHARRTAAGPSPSSRTAKAVSSTISISPRSGHPGAGATRPRRALAWARAHTTTRR